MQGTGVPRSRRLENYSSSARLGADHDYSALAVIERNDVELDGGWRWALHLRRGRCPIGVLSSSGGEGRQAHGDAALDRNCILVIDATGVGGSGGHVPGAYLRPVAVTITAGNKVTRDGTEFGVPKRDLIGVLEASLQTGRFKVARAS